MRVYTARGGLLSVHIMTEEQKKGEEILTFCRWKTHDGGSVDDGIETVDEK